MMHYMISTGRRHTSVPAMSWKRVVERAYLFAEDGDTVTVTDLHANRRVIRFTICK